MKKEKWEVSKRWNMDGTKGVRLPSGTAFIIMPIGQGTEKERRERIEKEVLPFLESGEKEAGTKNKDSLEELKPKTKKKGTPKELKHFSQLYLDRCTEDDDSANKPKPKEKIRVGAYVELERFPISEGWGRELEVYVGMILEVSYIYTKTKMARFTVLQGSTFLQWPVKHCIFVREGNKK